MKRWRANNGEKFFAVNIYGHVEHFTDNHLYFDDELYDAGNYFRTREQASEVALQIRALLKKNMATP